MDSLSNALCYVVLPFALGFSLSGGFIGFPLSKVIWIGLCGAAIHSITTMMDYNIEKRIGINTFAVKFGQRNAAIFAFLMFLAALTFGNFLSDILNYYLIFCTLLSLTLAIYPKDRYARLVAILICIGFIISAIFFLSGWLI